MFELIGFGVFESSEFIVEFSKFSCSLLSMIDFVCGVRFVVAVLSSIIANPAE